MTVISDTRGRWPLRVPRDDITASRPTGKTVAVVSGGTLGGAVSGGPGATDATTGLSGAVAKLHADADTCVRHA